MFQLLTADDEPDKLEALRSQYDWKGCQVEICGEAQNGIDAYEQLVAKKPDICIMDIKMPLLSGLEVIKRVQKLGVPTKYIILSGYDEFNYAKEAIDLSVVDYLLKPCRPEDITRSVRKCISLIETEQRQSKLQEDYAHMLEDHADISRKQFLNSLMLGLPIDNFERQSEVCRLALGNSIAVCVFDVDQVRTGENRERGDLLQLCKKVGSALAASWPSMVSIVREQIVAVMGMDRIADEFNFFYNTLKTTLSSCYPYKINFSVGVSDCKNDIKFLKAAYLEAKQAAEVSKFLFQSSILFYAELRNESSPSIPENSELHFIRNLSDVSEIEKLVTKFLEACTTCSVDVEEKTKESVITLICSLYKLCKERGFSFKEFSEIKSNVIKQIMESDSIENIRSVLMGFILTIEKNITDLNSISSLVRRTINYIQQNYKKHITLESAAETIHVTPPYLSMLFKQQTGSTFIEYVNWFRVKRACDLLRTGSLKSYEIAFDVGFQDEKYFHNIFKRYTGMTTKQFRDKSFTCAELENHCPLKRFQSLDAF